MYYLLGKSCLRILMYIYITYVMKVSVIQNTHPVFFPEVELEEGNSIENPLYTTSLERRQKELVNPAAGSQTGGGSPMSDAAACNQFCFCQQGRLKIR